MLRCSDWSFSLYTVRADPVSTALRFIIVLILSEEQVPSSPSMTAGDVTDLPSFPGHTTGPQVVDEEERDGGWKRRWVATW
jgi:hypothetical protein